MEDTVVDHKSRTPLPSSIETSNRNKSPTPAAPLVPTTELPHHPASNSASAQATEKTEDSAAQPSPMDGPPPGVQSEKSPTPASTTTATAPRETNGGPAADAASKQSNGHTRTSFDDNESELSEPDSNVHSPLPVGLSELEEDEIVVGAKTNGRQRSSLVRVVSDNEDETMADAQDEPAVSHYPKRKRNSVFTDLSESKMELPTAADGTKLPAPAPVTKPRPGRQSLGSVKGVLLGQWRDSHVPEKDDRHAVIGFIDVRDRLRTRIQPVTVGGDAISNEYPLPSGPGGSWVTFDRVIFSKHLVGLDHFQVKEYVRLRSEAHEDSEEERKAAEKAAVKEAIRRVKENPLYENPTTQPAIAHGPDLPDSATSPGRDTKRRRVSGGFSAINPSTNNDHEQSPAPQSQQPLQPRPTNGPPNVSTMRGPLPGTRPTRILLGYWKGSSEPELKDRHAVYGILGQNDMFRVKVVRETRDGRFVDGNFPSGAGALWIQYEEVEFEPHLKPLSRSEIKEYCRVRQYQIDHGELSKDRIANETTAVFEAQTRAGGGYRHVHQAIAPNYPSVTPEETEATEQTNGKAESGQPEPRQSRRTEARATPRQSLNENDLRPASRVYNDAESREPRSAGRAQNSEPLERANALARREIARVEAAQGRADRHALHREKAAALAADAAAAAAAAVAAVTPTPVTNGKSRFHESEDMQRLNKVWARQESLRVKAGAEDAKIYDGVKYERKTTGPFMGKLVSQGTIINIDGEDYVEYRVLTKPSFF